MMTRSIRAHTQRKRLPHALAVLTLAVGSAAHGEDSSRFTCNEPTSDGKMVATQRVVGGHQAPDGTWSWQVSIRQNGSHFCGGSLISPRWVLTAAHCMTERDGSVRAPGPLTIMSGSHDMQAGEIRQVTAVFRHPRYTGDTGGGFDLALLKLNEPASAPRMQLAGSDLERVFGPAQSCAVVTGWGTLQEGAQSLPRMLQEVDVPVLANEECHRIYGAPVGADQVCAGYVQGGKDSCQGDSGGPLMVQDPKGWIQIGIVSWGAGCAKANSPGVYTRVSHFVSWIQSTVSGN